MNTVPPKVLLIDSEMLIHLAVSQAFRNAGPCFVTAFNAGEALKKMELFSIDLFLLALDLKDDESLQLLKVIDERFPDAPVILMANNDTEYYQLIGRIEATKKQGSWQLIEKPFNLDILTILIERCLFDRDRSKGEQPIVEIEDYEKRNHLRNPHVQTIHLLIEAAEGDDQERKPVKATLTDISDGGLGLITKYLLKKSQPVTIVKSSIGKSGVVAWTALMDNHICRAGIQFC